MPGRITDQLRRITREQGGASPPEPDGPAAPQPRGRRYGPLVALAILLVLAGAGWLVIRAMMDMSRIQDCVMAGRKNCAPVDNGAGR
ncbi:MAG TPA: hypothetical protein VGG39_34570 [Polyangiaceae bacterium]